MEQRAIVKLLKLMYADGRVTDAQLDSLISIGRITTEERAWIVEG